MKEGIEAWQKAFEAAGFKNAIIAKDAPVDDPDWDAEDVRYTHDPLDHLARAVVRRDRTVSQTDPRTGQILTPTS